MVTPREIQRRLEVLEERQPENFVGVVFVIERNGKRVEVPIRCARHEAESARGVKTA